MFLSISCQMKGRNSQQLRFRISQCSLLEKERTQFLKAENWPGHHNTVINPELRRLNELQEGNTENRHEWGK
jgi:hypothetical protein